MAGGVIERFHAANSDFTERFYGVCGGKEAGRGAYICYDINCLNKAKKNKKIESSLNTKIDDTIYSQIEEIIKNKNGGDVIG